MENYEAHLFVDACSAGDTSLLSKLIAKHYKPATVLSMIFSGFDSGGNKEYAANHGLYQACFFNRLEVVKELFKSAELQSYLKMDRDFATYFRICCDKGFHEIVNFLLTDESVIVKPDVNAGNPAINKLNFTTDYAALSQFGSGTPFSLSCHHSHNRVLEILLDYKRIKQLVHPVTIEEGFVTCLRKENIEGARIIKDNSNVLETIIRDSDAPAERFKDNGKIALECYTALIAGKMNVVDFLVDECGFIYKDQYKKHNPEMHTAIESYLLQKTLNTDLDIQEVPIKRKMKI